MHWHLDVTFREDANTTIDKIAAQNQNIIKMCIRDRVYTLKKVMEELDFSGLLANCSDKGRIGYNPIMMYAVVTLSLIHI